MRHIKVLSMFVILVVVLLLISSIRTYAGNNPAAAIIQCDGDLLIVKSAITDTDYDCCTGNGCDCQVGDRCADCLEECIDLGYSSEVSQTGSGKVTYLLRAFDLVFPW